MLKRIERGSAIGDMLQGICKTDSPDARIGDAALRRRGWHPLGKGT
jgi:hypothetical protein